MRIINNNIINKNVNVGVGYDFDSYSVELKRQLHYTETDVNTVSFIGILVP